MPTAPLQNDRRDDDDERAPQSIAPKPLIRTRTHFRYDNGTGRSLFHWMLGRSNPDEGLTEDGTITAQSEDPEKAQGGKKRGRKGKFVSRPKPRNRLAETLLRLVGNTSKNAKRVNGAEEPEVLQEREGTEKLILQPLDRCIFDGLYPRGPALDYDLLLSSPDTNLLAEYLDTSKSTARTFADWLSSDDKVQSAGTLSSNPLENLFVIAHRDTLNVLRLIDVALKEIGQQVLDDTLIQERLVHWRHLLENFEAELQRLDQSLRGFAKFIEQAFTTSTSGGNIPESASSTDSLLRNCIDQISEVRRRTSRSYKSLMANLSIAESKRGIAEAESVTKLTELAFFFIPLTFSASLFSMQIKEINADSLSVAVFLAVAIIITTCSYALRLFIRSESVIEFRRHCAGEIRADGKIPSGGFIPTSVFLIWVWHRIGLLAITITVLVVVLTVPLIFVWTRNMNHGYKAIITVLELLLVLGTSYLVVKATLYFDPRGRLHFRRDMFAKQSAASGKAFIQTRSTGFRFALPASSSLSSRWFLFILTATLIALGPMVAVWTRPLVTGIKVGVTIVIGFIYAGSVIAVILYTVSSTSHAINDDDSE